MAEYIAGNEFQVALIFTNPNPTPGATPARVLATPASLTYVFQFGAGTETTWAWPTGTGSGNFTLVSTGVITVAMDTTLGAGDNGGATVGPFTIRTTSLGACAANDFIEGTLAGTPI